MYYKLTIGGLHLDSSDLCFFEKVKTKSNLIFIRNIIFLMVLLATGACTSTLPYQSDQPLDQICTDAAQQDQCAGTYYRQYKDYDLGFVEYSERGNTFDTTQLQDVLGRIEEKSVDEGVITVVFVHGWLNNAKEDNPNLQNFRKVLQSLAEGTRSYGSDRRVVGLFVGWRGASIPMKGLRLLTFWSRKDVAQNVGSGGVTRLLLELDRISGVDRGSTPLSQKNIMITVGHSFGGAMVLSSVKNVLVERLIASKKGNSIVNGIGDEVVLLNPAIEANQALTLVDVAQGRKYDLDQGAIMTIISSDQDSATHKAFPAGQLFGTLALDRQESLERDWYVDRNTRQKHKLREEDLDGITVGNFAPFLTHRIELNSTDNKNDGCTTYSVQHCEIHADSCEAKGWNRTNAVESIKSLPEHYPLRFIKTDNSLIKDHSDIFGPSVSILLRGLIESRLTGQPWQNSSSLWKTFACVD